MASFSGQPQQETDYRITLRLTDYQQVSFQEELDREGGARCPAIPRLRFPAGRRIEVEFVHLGGPRTRVLAPGRDLSASGLGLFHSSYLHPGTQAGATLKTTDGEAFRVTGRVTRCTHVRGPVHEVGIILDAEIDPTMFVGPSVASAVAAAKEPDYALGATLASELAELMERRAPGPEVMAKLAEIVRRVRSA